MISFRELANAIRFLSVDAVEKAQSGHPGMPLGMADIATVLWQKFLRYNPKNPKWFNRDRFILSNGHGAMLHYALLHLTGYSLTLQDLQQFRTLHSKTPGHPECTETPGIETTTGPLGQGLANAVGMAIAEKILSSQFNDTHLSLVNHFTYVFVGDGCLMEGISHEACSLAGTLGLGKLIAFYDNNGISIDGNVQGWFTDDTAMRFRSYHWHVIENIDGHDHQAIEQAIIQAQQEQHKPTLIICNTIIGFGSIMAGSEKTHGAPLGKEDIQQLREHLEWPYAPFEIPPSIYALWDHKEQGHKLEHEWLQICHQMQQESPQKYYEFLRRINGDLPDAWPDEAAGFLQQCLKQPKNMATRKASQLCIEFYTRLLPELLGGSADLSESNNTYCSQSITIDAEHFSGNYIHYGVREFGMSAIMNGLALHGGLIPFGGTFLTFADYAKNAVRLCALMKQRVIFVYTHDSIGLGEDGPTHQPIEQVSMLRMMPGLTVWRPADLLETAVAWQQAIEQHFGPSCLLFSRQSLPALPHTDVTHISAGGYILSKETTTEPDIILIATGSEVHLALNSAQTIHNTTSIQVRVISMPCVERFLAQDRTYQDTVLPPSIRKRIVIEAGSTAFWYRFTGLEGKVIGIDQFGASAPAADVYQALHLTTEHIVASIHHLMGEPS
jgi:transketolase